MINSRLFKVRKTWMLLLELVVVLAALVSILPIIVMVLASLKTDAAILAFDSVVPKPWTFENYAEIAAKPSEIPIGQWLWNSFFIATSSTVLVLSVSSLCAYALARLNVPGRKTAVALLVGTMMVPGQILLVPVYLILNALGWIDSPRALIIPAGAGAFGVFLLYQFFKGVPRDLEDAASIDGYSRLGIYWHVVLPLSRPALAALGIFSFSGSWNSFLQPLVFLESLDRFTLPVGIALFQSSYSIEYDVVFAACTICTLPVLVVFLFFQRHIIRGISFAGLKE